ncbi:DNA-packaging protein [Hyphomonas sp.]|uniref:DNA-packaging protein n=1 Tax=Hyphomonas sp. TaxID=87 RepID=UPI00391B0D7C
MSWRRAILQEVDQKGLTRIDGWKQSLLRRHPFLLDARPTQVPPPDLSRTWLLSGGRGAGKTRAGAEWVRWAVLEAGYGRVALVAPTFSDVREVMIEGPSGLIWTATHPDDLPVWQPSRHRLEWKNGAVAYGFSAEDPDSLRGPQFDLAWCDEAGAWARGEAAWDNLQLALRLGPKPMAMVTTTPRVTALIRRLKADPGVVETRTRMADNAGNLAPGFPAAMQAAYGGTALGRQELDGEMIDDPAGALFVRSQIDALRIGEAPLQFDDCIVAVDPCISAKPGADACGIILAGVRDGAAYVLGDASAPGLAPLEWAERAVNLAEIGGASMILAEANQGGDMVRQVISMTGTQMPVRLVSARLGKRGRAMPVAALYAQGKVHHAGTFQTLEDQMCRFGTAEAAGSPDRVDALVWALWALMIEGRGPRVRVLG